MQHFLFFQSRNLPSGCFIDPWWGGEFTYCLGKMEETFDGFRINVSIRKISL